MLLSILIPVFNEESLACQLLAKVADLSLDPRLQKEIIIVDDGSSDETFTRIEAFIQKRGDASIRLLAHPANRGKGAAVRTAMEASQGEILIVQDADLEYDPQDIMSVLKPILENRAQVVYGSRILMEKARGRSGFMGLMTGKHPHSYVLAYLGGVAITRWTNLICGSNLTDEPTCYKCFLRTALSGIQLVEDDFAWEPEITAKLLARGFTIQEVPISYHPRLREEGKKIRWTDGVKALHTIWKYRPD